ncbi:MAG: YaiI/YqxD family protein [Planctomycetes bacterium]|nr:YaiI/YqxD family protein [Planctomycetota bacterium]
MRIHVDADGCPVKDEVYKVAKRYRMEVCVVANKWMETPRDPLVRMIVVSDGFDAADDWIAEHAEADDIVVTSDIPLAARALKKNAYVIDGKGRRFTEGDIGSALAARALNAHLRESGLITGGPAPFRDRDRSQFLQALDTAIQAGKRKRGTT